MNVEDRISMSEPPSQWLTRVFEGAARWETASSLERKSILAELWEILNLGLQVHVRAAVRRLGARIDEADVLDIAADKTLELVRRIDEGRWRPGESSPDELGGFLATVARNGVVDLLRRRVREVALPEGAHEDVKKSGAAPAQSVDPDPGVEGAEYAGALVRCLEALTHRARRAWVLRAIYDVPSAEVGRDPDVATSAGGVDLLLSRSRRRIEECLQSRGLAPRRVPPGAFIALWDMIDAARPARWDATSPAPDAAAGPAGTDSSRSGGPQPGLPPSPERLR